MVFEKWVGSPQQDTAIVRNIANVLLNRLSPAKQGEDIGGVVLEKWVATKQGEDIHRQI